MKLERSESGSEEAQANGREPIVRDGARRRFLWLMVEYFRTLGYSDVKARLPGHATPSMLNGTLEDHRPDLTCRQGDRRKTLVLLASAARLYAAELHFVVPRWTRLGSIDRRLRHRLRELGLSPNRIWQV